MKKLLQAFFLSFSVMLFLGEAHAQTYSNSWINYKQTYYKFKILTDQHVYEIPYSTLSAAGLSGVTGVEFQLFKNGKEVPIYVTSDSSLGTNDYILFYGTRNDGWVDSGLYQAGGQTNTQFSMFTDSASYYLTYSTGNHEHYKLTTNSLTGHGKPQPYCLYKVEQVYGQRNETYYYPGYYAFQGPPKIYLPEWDNGEGYLDTKYTYQYKGKNAPAYYTFSTPNAYSSKSLQATVTGTIWGYSNYFHQVQFGVNNKVYLKSPPFGLFLPIAPYSFNYTVPDSGLTASTALFILAYDSSNSLYDEDIAAHMEITYARLFNFGGSSVLRFVVPGSTTGNQFLAITNYNNKSTTPLLFDTTNLLLLQGALVSDSVYYNLPASLNNRVLVITSQDPSDIATIGSLQKINFVDYTNPANEGDFIIISNPVLFNDGTGSNYVQQFADFKNSCGYHAIVVDINQLYDQFAYGVQRHPLSIRNFALYARQHWTTKPKYIFIIGKGSQWESIYLDQNGQFEDFNDDPKDYLPLCLVPTYGTPGADELFTATNYDPTPAIPVGRLSTTNPADIAAYLQKEKDFVSNQTTTPFLQTIENKLWQKDLLHLAGGVDATSQELFQSYLAGYDSIITKPLYGAKVYSFYKNSPNPIQQITSVYLASLINNGLSLMTFFGHSSPNSFDFNLDNPSNFNNYKKYPMILSNGCYLGDIFQSTTGLSEEWVNIPNKGAIAFLASSQLAEEDLQDLYSNAFYRNLDKGFYHNAIGDYLKNGIKYIFDTASVTDGIYILLTKLACEQMILNGDPSLSLNTHPKPDYVLEPSVVHFSPAIVTAANDTFDVVVYPTNIGMAIDTSIYISVTRTFPNGNVALLYEKKIKAPYYQDSMRFKVYTDSTLGYGLNKFTITIDSRNQIDEITKTNNSVTVDIYINGEDILPDYPYDYSIVNQQNITNNKGLVLKASTVNPFAKKQLYHMQIDTTALFNSPLFQKNDITQTGGVVKWLCPVKLLDSVVYYWRVAIDTNNGQYNWHTYSFIYLPKSSPGWNQSHYYQYKNDNFGDIYIDSTNRKFTFVPNLKDIYAQTGVTNYGKPAGPISTDSIYYTLNTEQELYENCVYGSCGEKTTFMIAVFDSVTGLPIPSPPGYAGCGGEYNSINCQNYALNGFFFNTTLSANTQAALTSFITGDIPNGDYVLGFTIDQAGVPSFSPSLLAALKTLGCTIVDTVTLDRPYMFFGKKNGGSNYHAIEILAKSALQTISGNFIINGRWDEGYVQSPVIGPAVQWTSLHWKHDLHIKPRTDSSSVTIYGVNGNNTPVPLYKAFRGTDLALNFINPKLYPNIYLQLNTIDTFASRMPAQLNFWRINYQPVPDAAINPSAYFSLSKDTPFQQGEPFELGVDVDNISDYNMDSLWMKYAVTSSSGALSPFFVKNRPLPANDSMHVNFNYTVPTVNNSGLSNLFIEVNPYEHHQPEEYHYNNLGDFPFGVSKDLTNPILDVTFDGIHILNNDIVSAKPDIFIRLKDENKFLSLNDTSDVKVYLIYPNSKTPVPVHYNNGATMVFTPAPAPPTLSSTNNICTIDYKPMFLQDGFYTLIVVAHDSAGNVSGANPYQITFEIINKEMISSVLNYPNPFTSSTRFVFTLTGSAVPTFFKIEIMTISGRIVKEITQNDIGPLHIGTNISQYAWNGTDQYGNALGNGLYLYHVVASVDGQSISHYDSQADQYIKSGFGKMYLMR